MGTYRGLYKNEKSDKGFSRTEIFEADDENQAAEEAIRRMREDEKVVVVVPVTSGGFILDESKLGDPL